MYDYIYGIIKNASQIYKESAGSATPDPDHLYGIRDAESKNHGLLIKDKTRNVIPSRRNVYMFQNEVHRTFNIS